MKKREAINSILYRVKRNVSVLALRLTRLFRLRVTHGTEVLLSITTTIHSKRDEDGASTLMQMAVRRSQSFTGCFPETSVTCCVDASIVTVRWHFISPQVNGSKQKTSKSRSQCFSWGNLRNDMPSLLSCWPHRSSLVMMQEKTTQGCEYQEADTLGVTVDADYHIIFCNISTRDIMHVKKQKINKNENKKTGPSAVA